MELFNKIIEFQGENGLNVDGKAWNETLKALELIDNNQTSRDFYK
jgi:hypothetical protein